MQNSRHFYRIILSLFFFLLTAPPVHASSPKSEHIIPNVPLICQHPELPTGCEITALTMFLNFHGNPVNKMQVMNLLPIGKRPYRFNGVLYGSDPRYEFVGDPTKKDGLGIYHPPIVKLLQTLYPKRVVNATGQDIHTLLDQVQQGNPVMIWTSIPLRNGRLELSTTGATWLTPQNEYFTWIHSEHAMILVGFTNNRQFALLNDPYTGKMLKFPLSELITSYNTLGRQAIYLSPRPQMEYAHFHELTTILDDTSYELNLYNIQNNLYINIRDFAMLLSGKENQFDLHYEKGVLQIRPGNSYQGNPNFATLQKENRNAIPASTVLVLEEYPLNHTSYLIDSSHYYKIRDLCQTFGMEVTYSGENKTLTLKRQAL